MGSITDNNYPLAKDITQYSPYIDSTNGGPHAFNPPMQCWGTDGKWIKGDINSTEGIKGCAGGPTGLANLAITQAEAIKQCNYFGNDCQGVKYVTWDGHYNTCPQVTTANTLPEGGATQPCWMSAMSIASTITADGQAPACGGSSSDCTYKNSVILFKQAPNKYTNSVGVTLPITNDGQNYILAKDITQYSPYIDSTNGGPHAFNPPMQCWGTDGKWIKGDINSTEGIKGCAGGPTGLANLAITQAEAIKQCNYFGNDCQGVKYVTWDGHYNTCPQVTTANTLPEGGATQPCWMSAMSIASTITADGQAPACGGSSSDCTYKNSVTLFKTGYNDNSGGLWCLASITKIPKIVDGKVQHVEIKDLKVGDIVQTTRGNMPISDIMKTDTKGYVHDNYVRVEKEALGENFPSEDLYVTHEHSFSLGYYKNSLLNRNIHDNEQDDMVYLHITADQLADKLSGITRVSKEFESAINLVFDEHTSINVYGLDIMMHHPKGNPHILSKDKYQDKSKFNNKVQKPLFASYDMLVNAKPKHMEMKDFLRGCITADLNNKLNLEDVNNISFTPQKTMLTDDLRQKLKVV